VVAVGELVVAVGEAALAPGWVTVLVVAVEDRAPVEEPVVGVDGPAPPAGRVVVGVAAGPPTWDMTKSETPLKRSAIPPALGIVPSTLRPDVVRSLTDAPAAMEASVIVMVAGALRAGALSPGAPQSTAKDVTYDCNAGTSCARTEGELTG
jgi:hypothetical protein